MAGRDGEAQRFFVSYADADRGWAEWIAWELENAKHEVLIQAWDFGPGLHFVGMMNRAFDGGRRTVAVLSAAYLESAFTTEEWQAAWAANPDGQERLLLVARVEDCDPPPLLRQVVYVDLFGVDKEVARERLLDAITLRRRKPAEEPAFPRTLGRGTAEPSRPSQVRAMAVPAARSAYLEQVRQIAPRRLVGREAELARLAAFCAAPDDPTATGYMWWRAAAWTGKSALMSTFVLDPPAGVRVVSFFITSRYAGNSNRAAFVEIVTEQLAELLDESVPPFQDEGRRERLWFKWFADAAAFCKARGERLVLVVDGLDEDRGVTGHGARSIAGLLPANPREGARVVVAGRPDPPVPSDVPPGHPLRNPSIIEILGRSEHAAAIRADMREALYRLRTGGPLERDLLGLVTAAGGGLSGRDLEELSTDSDVTEWDIDQLLETVAGRGFSRRAARWNPAAGPRVYLLGHEEIQQDAERAYGRTKLAAYRDRLHTWAEEYRQRGWAADTPEYLLRGYYRLLLATGDLPRAVDCATDQARHDRMLDLSGGDTAALAEITEAQNALLAQPSPDVTLMARLAVHKQQITERNRNIPIRLPAVWVTLGHATRAEQLAHAIADPDSRVRALVTVARALVEVGEHSRAAQVVSDTEQLAHAMTDPNSRVWALVTVARVLVEVGERGRAAQVVSDAEQVARAVTRSDSRAEALVSVAGALAEMGEYGRAAQVVSDAEQVARAVTHPFFRVWALVSVARALAKAGEHGRAAQVVSDAEQVARAITDPFYQARALVLVAGTLAPAGEPARAEQVARAITSPDCLVQALVPVAEALAEVGEHGRAAQIASDAEQAARAITDPDSQVRALVTLAEALAEVGEHGRAAQVVSDAEQVARAMTDPASRGRELAPVARVLAQAGELARAEEVARAITDPFLRIRALAPWAEEWAEVAEHIARSDPDSMVRELMTVAKALAQAGKLARAAQVASDAEQVARAITDPFLQARALVTVVDALAEAGEFARAEQLAHAMTGPFFQARALVTVVDALAEAGEFARAEQLADAMTGPFFQAEALVTVVYALAEAGEFARAEQLAHAITDPDFQVRALVRVAGALAEVGERGRAAQVVSDAEQVARAITDPFFRVRALVTVVYALAKVGERGRAAQAANDAEQVARAMTKPEVQAWALVAVAGALASVEGRVRAAQAANDAEQVARGMTNPDVRARVLVTVAGALAEVGEFARAEQVVRAITRSESQVEALVTVAGALAEAGEHARAEQLARALADPYSQAEALVAVAGALAQANSRTSANRLLAVALSVGDWRRLPLPVVAGVSPDAIRAMAAAIVSDQTA